MSSNGSPPSSGGFRGSTGVGNKRLTETKPGGERSAFDLGQRHLEKPSRSLGRIPLDIAQQEDQTLIGGKP